MIFIDFYVAQQPNSPTMSLSQRGQRALNKPLRADLDLFFAAMEDRYHPQENPAGKFALCVAENLLNWTEMEAKLREIAAGPMPEWVPSYTSILGAPQLREAAAGFLGHFVGGRLTAAGGRQEHR